MSNNLYRKYRPLTLDQVIGQDIIVKALKQAIKLNKLNHAYLFTGPRGVGKTSIARILAHEINQLDYLNPEDNNLDIIEIDAASNSRVDEIRELKELAYVAPNNSRYKVYIIDEVHMLSNAAFNALLKILEEPPSHVIFILATTEAHKIPETIISRTQRFSFHTVSENQLEILLKEIAKKENIKYENEAIKLIAQLANGSARDAINIFDQLTVSGDKITQAIVDQTLGLPSLSQITELIDALATNNSQSIAQKYTQLIDQGYAATVIAKMLADNLRISLITNQTKLTPTSLVKLLRKLSYVKGSQDSENYLLATLISQVHVNSNNQSTELVAQTTTKKSTPIIDKSSDISSSENNSINSLNMVDDKHKKPTIETSDIKNSQTSSSLIDSDVDQSNTKETNSLEISSSTINKTKDLKLSANVWENVLNILKKSNNTLYGIARMADITIDNNQRTITLCFAYDFHRRRVNDSKNKEIIATAIKSLTNESYEILTIVDKTKLKTTLEKNKDSLEVIQELFLD